MKVYESENGRAGRLMFTGDEKKARREAASILGRTSLRGLKQAATERGVRYYEPGADDETGTTVEVVY